MFIASIVCITFSFATGIFTALSMIERPVWKLMVNVDDEAIEDDHVRAVHGQLDRLTHYLPLIMKTTMLVGGMALLTQGWLRGFDIAAISLLIVFLVGILFLVSQLQRCIDGVTDVRSDTEDLYSLKSGTGALARLHHLGLSLALTIVTLELVLISPLWSAV